MFADIAAIEVKLRRPLDDVEREDAERLLREAANLLKSRIPDLETRATADEVFAGIAEMVQLNAVCRVLRNPEGLIDEGQDGWTGKPNIMVSSGVMAIMPSEWKTLGLDTGSGYLSLDAWRFMKGGS